MAQYQTVIYDRSSGSILTVLPNQYIANKKRLARFAGTQSPANLSFVYFTHDIAVDPAKHHVTQPSFPGPPYITDAKGTNISVLALFTAAEKLLLKSNTLLCSFEGGLGDYINQGNVISQLLSQYPEKEIYISGRRERFELLSFFPNFDKAIFTTKAKALNAGTPLIDFSHISRMDYNYPPFGKRGVYASLAGIHPTFPRATLSLPKASLTWAAKQWSSVSPGKNTPRISLHTRSGEPNSKTWPWNHTLELIKLLRHTHPPSFALFGGHGQESLQEDYIIDGVGVLDWLQVAAIVKTSHLTICIDSAIMHIAHHLDIPTLSLWGPTAATYILPTKHGTPVIESQVPCHPCGNYSCRKGDCMQSITPDQVSKKALSILHSLSGTR